MKLVFSIAFWISIGPAAFFLLLDLLIAPARWASDSVWGVQRPTAANVGIGIYALVTMILAGWVVWRLWKRVRALLLTDPGAQTWLDRLPARFRLPLALGLVLVGAAIVFIGIGTQLPLTGWRPDAILLGCLVQGTGLLGIVLALRRRGEEHSSTIDRG